MDDVLAASARMAADFADEMIKAQGRAERAEAEADQLRDQLELATNYIQACANLGDAGAKATLRVMRGEHE